MKNPHDIILRPVLTEKGYDGIADKRYVFEVAISANKTNVINSNHNRQIHSRNIMIDLIICSLQE